MSQRRKIPDDIRRRVAERAEHRCKYLSKINFIVRASTPLSMTVTLSGVEESKIYK